MKGKKPFNVLGYKNMDAREDYKEGMWIHPEGCHGPPGDRGNDSFFITRVTFFCPCGGAKGGSSPRFSRPASSPIFSVGDPFLKKMVGHFYVTTVGHFYVTTVGHYRNDV